MSPLSDALMRATETPLLDLRHDCDWLAPNQRRYSMGELARRFDCEPSVDDEIRPINVLASLAYLAGLAVVIGVAALCCYVILANFLIVAGAH